MNQDWNLWTGASIRLHGEKWIPCLFCLITGEHGWSWWICELQSNRYCSAENDLLIHREPLYGLKMVGGLLGTFFLSWHHTFTTQLWTLVELGENHYLFWHKTVRCVALKTVIQTAFSMFLVRIMRGLWLPGSLEFDMCLILLWNLFVGIEYGNNFHSEYGLK